MSSLRRTLFLACLLSFPALAQQPARPAITGIAFARFYTTEPEAAQKFYGTTLGFERKETDDMWIYPVNHSQWIEVLTAPPPPKPNVRMAAVAFTTTDVTQLEHYLEAHNIKPRFRSRTANSASATRRATSSSSSRKTPRSSSRERSAHPSPPAPASSTSDSSLPIERKRTPSGNRFSASVLTGMADLKTTSPIGSASRSPTARTGSNTCSTPAPILLSTKLA